MYLTKIVTNMELDNFLSEFESGGDYEDYEIVAVSWNGSAALFVLKEKAEAK